VHDQPWQISLKLWIRFIFRKILAALFFVKKYLKKTGGRLQKQFIFNKSPGYDKKKTPEND